MELFERLLSNIDKIDRHWLWTGTLSWNGYGLLYVDGKMQRAHILSYQEFVGPIPKGLCVLHKRECVKLRHCICPEHLYPGNRGDNSQDCFDTGGRGRSNLSNADVVTIRTSTEGYEKIATKFNITVQAVSQIKHKHTWKNVAPEVVGIISSMARSMPGYAGGRGSSKLSDQDILDIRASSLSRGELALKYGLQKQSVAHILKRHTFKNL